MNLNEELSALGHQVWHSTITISLIAVVVVVGVGACAGMWLKSQC